MWNFNQVMIEYFVQELKRAYQQTYSVMEPQYGNITEWTGRLALENIANSDSLYHNVEHTIMVTLVGQLILKGKHLSEGGVTPQDWLHFTMALLCHDIGYVKGVCQADRYGEYATGIGDQTVVISEQGTNAALTPYHVDRSKLFVMERFGGKTLVDFVNPETIAAYIEITRFPTPDDREHRDTKSYGGLLRAADFIGQIGDPNYLRKIPALFYEFEETGENARIGYESPGHMRRNFVKFYFNVVAPYIQDAIRYLNVTQEGKLWVASLYAHVHKVEHEAS
ncbi:MAG: hypothetical protein JXA78_01815 [Anaerolineales bacterium]|nr:hypothetical protein [Anaerolineales bacterium]